MVLVADDNFMKTAEKVLTCNELLRLIYPLDMMLKSPAYIKRQKRKYDQQMNPNNLLNPMSLTNVALLKGNNANVDP